MKKVIAMQDISCVGKCSLTAVLPVLSAMGIEASPLPTALLSAHTMFKDPYILDLTDSLMPIMNHWQKEGFTFDGILTGYLGSIKQITAAVHLIDTFGTHACRIVDPCMADHGKFYAGFDQNYAVHMKQLCARADIICPNLTEAALLLNQTPKDTYTIEECTAMAEDLTRLTPTVIHTGIEKDSRIGAMICHDKTVSCFYTDKEPVPFHGTGDLWAAVLTGALVKGRSLDEAVQLACTFIQKAIHATLQEENHSDYGVSFETVLPYLIKESL